MTVEGGRDAYHGPSVERLALIGVSHRRGGATALEIWQDAFDDVALEELERDGYHAFVPLVTCNRWDLVVRLPQGVDVERARERLTPPGSEVRPYAFVRDGALEQLTRIASSLDSLNPGEDQIMRQVREAYQDAQARGRVDTELSFAFDTALRIAKRVRRDVALAPMNTSLFSLARPAIEAVLRPGDRVVVVGTGEMGTLAAKALAELGDATLLVVNRSADRARQVARHLGAGHASLADFLQAPTDARALVAATPARDLIGASVLQAMPNLALVVDLGVPRNVAHDAAEERNIRVLDVDTLQSAGASRRVEIAEKLGAAERIVQDELLAAVDMWTERQLGPSIRRLLDWYVETIGDVLPADQARSLAAKFAHVPMKGLRAVARDHGMEAARTFLAESGLVREVEASRPHEDAKA